MITTPGAILIKHMLPTKEAREKFDISKPLDKGGMKDLVNILIQHGGDKSHETINTLSRLFFDKATEIGSSTPLSDYYNDSEERQQLLTEFESRANQILAKKLPKREESEALDNLSAELIPTMQKKNLIHMVQVGSVAAKMARTGARGNPAQLSQATNSPVLSADVKGNPIPLTIRHAYSEGLTQSEHLSASYGGRASTVMAQLSTEKPGALFKKLTPALFHEVITTDDCGTKNGVPLPVSDKHSILGRVEAKTNKLITEEYYNELRNSGHKTVLARSTMTCKAPEGVCQKCYGLAASGSFPPIGTNVGVIASQSVSEVLTQSMLSTKHKGGTAGQQRNPYEEANNLLTNPENFQDEATIAEANGKVESMKQSSLKDWNVMVGNKPHFISNLQKPLVQVGDTVRVGDPLSTGTLNPEKLVDLKGAGAGRVYLAGKMREIYSRDTKLDPRHFDLIARNMIKHNLVVDPGESGFLPGDKIEVGTLSHYLQDHSKTVPIEKAEGSVLSDSILGLTPGTLITRNHIDDLKDHGIKDVSISTSGLTTKPIVPGLQSLKLLDKNWVSKLSFNHLHKTIQEAAAYHQVSPIHSTEPVSSYIIGTEFGEGANGKY
jgi:DNA-directed RNA polymerase subunit beta'